jgi:co-chaperonin GroES (HSP10)
MSDSKTIQVTPINKITLDPERSLLPIQMVGDRIIIDPIRADEFLSKELNIRKSLDAKEDFLKGIVMCIGGGEYGVNIPASLKTGMTVLYWHQSAINYVVDKKVYHLVRVSDAFAYL